MDVFQWIILTFGVAGVVLAQSPRLQRFAPFAGLAGQIGWFNSVSAHSQPGIWLTCVVYCGAWGWGLWLHWLRPLTNSTATPMADPLAGPDSLTGRAAAASELPKGCGCSDLT